MNPKSYELKYVNQFAVDKSGNPYKTKNGKPFVRVSIKVAEHGDNFISGLFFGENCPWKVGETVELVIAEEEYQGKKQLKFDIPRKDDKMLGELNNLALKIGVMSGKLDKIIKILEDDGKNSDGSPVPNFETDPLATY